jgi:hypothetical protein
MTDEYTGKEWIVIGAVFVGAVMLILLSIVLDAMK